MRGKISLTLKDCAPIDNNIVDLIPPESIAAYLYIKQRLKNKKSIYKDFEFRFVFSSFYGISNKTMERQAADAYFYIFEKARKSCSLSLSNLLTSHYKKNKGEKKCYFSFITKLMHSIDNELPIYDSNVNQALKPRFSYKNEGKIENATDYYNRLIEWYKKEMPANRKIKNTIRFFRNKFNCHLINDVKIADFILWQYGKLLKNQKNA
jgi:hypothetical protein